MSKFTGIVLTIVMLAASNLFMTFAWYWHLRPAKDGEKPWPLIAIILVSWGIALIEYCIAVPANRIGHAAGLNVAQLKIIQEVITVFVFVLFLLLVMKEKWNWDYLWALLCMVAAVYFVNRSQC
ncbi:MAG: DMT family protein [Kiritimatiellia bacterium]